MKAAGFEADGVSKTDGLTSQLEKIEIPRGKFVCSWSFGFREKYPAQSLAF